MSAKRCDIHPAVTLTKKRPTCEFCNMIKAKVISSAPTSTTGHTIDPAGVDHPAHYNQHPAGVECIDVIEHFPYNIGAAIKYLWRAGLKAGEASTKDLRKAAWYSEREAKRLEKARK
jgi:hypothetical protein